MKSYTIEDVGALVRKIDAQAATIARLRDALEATIHEIKMVHWMKFNGEGDFETVAEKNPVIVAARAALRSGSESEE